MRAAMTKGKGKSSVSLHIGRNSEFKIN